jgi:hypothetical protein
MSFMATPALVRLRAWFADWVRWRTGSSGTDPVRGLSPSAAGLLLCFSLSVHAQEAAEPPPPEQQDMYREALLSIAEGRRADASETLKQLIEKDPLHAGGWLEMALLQCSLGNKAEAERLFTAIEDRFAPPPEIQKLIDESRAQRCDRWEARSQYMLSAGRGIDQNVNQGANNAVYQPQPGSDDLILLPEFLPQHDQYLQFTGDYLRDLTVNGSSVFVQFQGRRYDRLHDYDSATLFAGIESPWRFGKWTLRTSATLGLMSLGGHYYQRQASVQANIGPPLPLPRSLQFNVTAGFTHVDYITLTNFGGNTMDLRGQFSYRSGPHYASAGFGLLTDHATAKRPGGDRHGALASLLYRYRWPNETMGEVGYTRQAWRGQTSYAPGLIDQVRDQKTNVLRASLSYPLSRRQTLQVEVRDVRNKENISIFQYNNRLLQINWQWMDL